MQEVHCGPSGGGAAGAGEEAGLARADPDFPARIGQSGGWLPPEGGMAGGQAAEASATDTHSSSGVHGAASNRGPGQCGPAPSTHTARCQPSMDLTPHSPTAACHPPACRPHLLVGTEGLGPPRWGPGGSSGVRATLRFDMGGPWRTHHRLKPPTHVYTGHPAKPVSGTLLTLMTPPPAPCRKPVTAGPLLARIFFTSNYDQMWTIESFDAS